MNYFGFRKKSGGYKPVGSSFREAMKYALCAVLVLMGALAYIWPHIRIVNLGYEKDKLRKEHEKLIQINRLMKIEVASLRSLEKIEEIAANQLKMVFPDDSHVVIVRTSPEKEVETGSVEKSDPGVDKKADDKENS